MKRNDLISRQAAIDALCDNCVAVQSACPHYPCKQYKDIVALPSAKPESNETVEWIWDGYYDEYACSYCGNLVGRDRHKLIFHNYCPCCGRKVKKERRNDEAD